MDKKLLKQILAIATYSHYESMMVSWLVQHFVLKHLLDRSISFEVDPIGNVYVTKGEAPFYPCVAAHTDSAHLPENLTIQEDGDHLIALNDDSYQTGLGGDDKAGIFECLAMIDKFPAIKAVFFVSEEIGCVGSRAAVESEFGKEFFSNVGYVMEFDSPCDTILSYSCDGVQLFPNSGNFFDIIAPLLTEHGVTKWQNHPFTDVAVLKRSFDFPCLNLPAGYFHMHRKSEYVSLKAVQNVINLGEKLITALGTKHYKYLAGRELSPTRVLVTGLITHG